MTKGTRTFRIIAGITLAILLLWTAFITAAFFYVNHAETSRRENERFGIYVCGVPVMFKNAADVLGDGTVLYDKAANRLILTNAALTCDGPAIYSKIDLTVELVGDNRITCTGEDTAVAVYASDNQLRKHLSLVGDGTLAIEVAGGESAHTNGIVADDLLVCTDVSVALSDAAVSSTGIECSYLCLLDGAAATVQAGSAEKSTAIFVRGDISLDEGTALKAGGAPSGKDSFGIECTGVITACEGAEIEAASGGSRDGIVCYGVLIDGGADIRGGIDAAGGVRREHAR